jgi:hypothetical protein
MTCYPSQPMPEVVSTMVRHSVHEYGIVEALRYKWIESEKAGRDLGESAIRTWVRHHWNGFLRARWLEHLEGRAFWIELDQDDYGLLQHSFLDCPLKDEVLDRLKFGQENLDLINWAIDLGQDVEEVIRLLEALDINSRRIECQFYVRLAQAG